MSLKFEVLLQELNCLGVRSSVILDVLVVFENASSHNNRGVSMS